MAMRVLTRDEARTALRQAKEYHEGKRELPRDITSMRKLIADKTRNAELFMARLGAVDEGMVNEIVQLKLKLDGMYGRMAIDETPRLAS